MWLDLKRGTTWDRIRKGRTRSKPHEGGGRVVSSVNFEKPRPKWKRLGNGTPKLGKKNDGEGGKEKCSR